MSENDPMDKWIGKRSILGPNFYQYAVKEFNLYLQDIFMKSLEVVDDNGN